MASENPNDVNHFQQVPISAEDTPEQQIRDYQQAVLHLSRQITGAREEAVQVIVANLTTPLPCFGNKSALKYLREPEYDPENEYNYAAAVLRKMLGGIESAQEETCRVTKAFGDARVKWMQAYDKERTKTVNLRGTLQDLIKSCKVVLKYRRKVSVNDVPDHCMDQLLAAHDRADVIEGENR